MIVTGQIQPVAHQYGEREFQKLDGRASEALSKINISVAKSSASRKTENPEVAVRRLTSGQREAIEKSG